MKNKKIILVLNNTWGIIMTLIGYVARIVMRCKGVKGEKQDFAMLYRVGYGWGAISLGTTIIVANDQCSEYTLAHETGHTIQNAIFGVLFPFVIGIPSLIRCQYYNHLQGKGIKPKRSYSSIWFEAQASMLGLDYRFYKED
jgi:hypothetical protein